MCSRLEDNGLAIEKSTLVNSKKFLTPTMMLTYSFRENNPRPWLQIPNCSVMTNAFDILKNTRLEHRIRKEGIHSELGLKSEICAMDSGGFQFISRGEEEKIDVKAVISLQRASKADIAVGLDYPILQNHSLTKIETFALKSLKNIELAYRSIQNGTEVMPVLHGTTPAEITQYFLKVNKIADFKIWGIGGLVPQMKQSYTSHTRYFSIIDRVIEARKLLNDVNEENLLHVFGVGSPLAGLLFLLLGVDSIESISWIMNAKYFLVYQDQIGARKVSKKTTMCTTSVKWDEYHCTCPICNGKDIKEVEQKMKLGGNEGFINRASHNAYIYQRILIEAKEALSENRLKDFCYDKLGSHKFFKGILKYTFTKLEECL